MTDEQWNSVDAHFSALAEEPAAVQAAGLARIEDAEVRAEVASLLRHSGGGDTLVGIVGATMDQIDIASFKDQCVGPYRIVRRLAEGGQGAVFEAVRADGSFDQRVAIKIVKWEMDSETARGQFRRERQILAGLEHPHIARLLDGGETEAGAPYLMMEYVAGQPLTRKLEMFLEVAGRGGVCASQSDCSSGFEAGEHFGDERGDAEAVGFRHRETGGQRRATHAHGGAGVDAGVC